jgi:hypothetical protein
MSCHTCSVIYHAANLENVTDGFTSPLKEVPQRIFIALGRIWTRELWSNGKHVITRPPRTANLLLCLTDCYMTSYGLSHMSCTTTVMHKVNLLKIFFKSTLFQEKRILERMLKCIHLRVKRFEQKLWVPIWYTFYTLYNICVKLAYFVAIITSVITLIKFAPSKAISKLQRSLCYPAHVSLIHNAMHTPQVPKLLPLAPPLKCFTNFTAPSTKINSNESPPPRWPMAPPRGVHPTVWEPLAHTLYSAQRGRA